MASSPLYNHPFAATQHSESNTLVKLITAVMFISHAHTHPGLLGKPHVETGITRAPNKNPANELSAADEVLIKLVQVVETMSDSSNAGTERDPRLFTEGKLSACAAAYVFHTLPHV